MEDQEQKPSRIKKIRSWYGKYERLISSWSLLCGFVFDAITLKRVDLFWENFWVVGHLVIVGTCIVLIQAIDRAEGDETNPSKLHFWLTNIQQFFYGGIWSTFLVFYFRSGDITTTWPFLLILALAFLANERLKRHFVRLAFQISLFFLALMSFAIYLLPVLVHAMGPDIFLLSGVFSLIAITLFLVIIWLVAKKEFHKSKWLTISAIAGIFIVVNILYFTNLIPPLPLSLKDAGVYYSLHRNAQGNYDVVGERQSWLDYFKLYPNFDYLPGMPIYIYSAIFSPPGLNQNVIHQWQKQDAKGNWQTVSQVNLSVVGGRDEGFRTYSQKTLGLAPGKWRVNVLTSSGQLIGRLRFNLVAATALPKVNQETK